MTTQNENKIDLAKQKAAFAAALLIEEGMKVGLGTGSTTFFFIEALIKKCREGLKIKAAATSKNSFELAKKGGIPLLDPEKMGTLDIAVDGADEIDLNRRMIKGGGGALLREKIIATSSNVVIIIVDESKIVPFLGKKPIPLEVLPFGCEETAAKVKSLNFQGHFRQNSDHSIFKTDNGNYIFDIYLDKPTENPEIIHQELKLIPGVLETGLFFEVADQILIGSFDGSVKTW